MHAAPGAREPLHFCASTRGRDRLCAPVNDLNAAVSYAVLAVAIIIRDYFQKNPRRCVCRFVAVYEVEIGGASVCTNFYRDYIVSLIYSLNITIKNINSYATLYTVLALDLTRREISEISTVSYYRRPHPRLEVAQLHAYVMRHCRRTLHAACEAHVAK